jgi:hypothetical protein
MLVDLLAPFAAAADAVAAGCDGELALPQIQASAVPSVGQSRAEKWVTTVRNATFAGGAAHLLLGSAGLAAPPLLIARAMCPPRRTI